MTNIDKVWIDEAEAMANNKLTDEKLTQVYATAREARLPVVWTEKRAMMHFKEVITPEIVESMAAELQEYRRVLAGLPDGCIEGGWTAAGIRAYAARLERELQEYRKAKSHSAWLKFQSMLNPDDPAAAPAVEAMSEGVAVFTCTICGRTTTHPEGWHYCKKGNEND